MTFWGIKITNEELQTQVSGVYISIHESPDLVSFKLFYIGFQSLGNVDTGSIAFSSLPATAHMIFPPCTL